MPTRNVVLTDHQAALIDRLVSSGHYQNASEVLRDGLRLVEERDLHHQTLRAALQKGDDDLAAGRYQDFESAEVLGDHLQEIIDDALGRPAPRRAVVGE